MKFSINLIQQYLVESLPEPTELERIFTFHLCEVEGLETLPDGDTLIDLNILPNRAHDMLGHYGVARELAGQLGLTLKPLVGSSIVQKEEVSVGVSIETDKCHRYMARRIDNITVQPSAQCVVDELAKKGQRSINNLVDATNSTMFITGQPTHVFDADKITGGITVRMARTGEKITLLGGQDIELHESIMIIADDVAPLAIAGIKGGKHAEVDENTKNIILEVANFDASTIRASAQKLNLRTDASYRFERDISPSVCDDAMNLLVEIIGVHGGAEQSLGVLTDVYPAPQTPTVIEFSLAEVVRVAGSSISNADVTNILQRYGFPYVEREDNFSVTIPLRRLDLTGRHDMIEEIIRVRGLDKIEPVAPPILDLQSNKLEELMTFVRKHLLSLGYNETMTYSFTDAGESSVLASAGDKSFLRANIYTTFSDSLVRNYRNRDLLGVDSIRQFEIGTVFNSISENIHLCMGIHNAKQKGVAEQLWKELSDMLYDLGLTEVRINECILYKNDFVIEINLSQACEFVTKNMEQISGRLRLVNEKFDGSFKQWSVYPYITRDIAVWTPEGTSAELLQKTYTQAAGELLVRPPRLVDQFTKDGRTSYAFRLVFQSYDRTLEDADIKPITDLIYQKLSELDFEVR